MSWGEPFASGQGSSPQRKDIQTSTDVTSSPEKDTPLESQSQTQEETNANLISASSSGKSLLEALWSPFSSLLESTPNQTQNQDSNPNQKPGENGQTPTKSQDAGAKPISNNGVNKMPKTPAKTCNKNTTKQVQDASISEESEPKTPPEAYYTPNEVPLFKKLQKKRLSGTRTKQLLRAASRAHDDPPPPPELGTCCGSSCDPCVNDLWKEERDVWLERWGDRAIKKDGERKELEW